ncbi:MAG: carbon-nitrogen hydrolase family protein [Acidobacteriota bacterium]
MSFLAAAIQLNGNSNEEACIEEATRLIRQAAAHGARFVATPEATNYLGPHDRKVATAEGLDGRVCRHFGELAAELDIHLLLGSFNESAEETARCYNTSVLFGSTGEVLASYRKMHLFDVDVSDEVRFQESATCRPGEDVVVAETELGAVGLSICYDMRFPELYRRQVDAGAKILAVPSAFTVTTGRDHWYPLLKARAIETQCWLIAPAQWGEHDDGGLRNSYGHSLIIDPWGQIVASCSDGTGIAFGVVDLDRVDQIRQSMPVGEHRKL